ncbi:MAG: undecaprenyl-diphosphate phosphatase [Porticoccaceae bacterium]|nr:undecaprenyl-diphosphate phosphatase [Porticoccaceae bacterium]
MTLFHVVILALIQGLTEFLPISSSAHLILPSQLLGWQDQGLAFDVAVHVGTLAAVVWYFRNDLRKVITDWFRGFSRGGSTAHSRLGWWIILATIPGGLAGLLFNDLVEDYARSMAVIATTTIVFGLLLGVADRKGARVKSLDQMGWREALYIGLAQMLALIPGTSRAGITITAALALGFDRVAAARFSFLLSIPIITLSGLFKGVELLSLEQVQWGALIFGAIVSGITAYLCIGVFLAVINRIGMMPFVWYRVILGVVLLAVIWLT